MKGLVDLDMVLDELWTVTQEEMNFLIEAANMEEFSRKNEDIAFVGTPALFKEYTTTHVLVMEYIDGFGIHEKERLLEEGYDLKEIGTKLVDNYIKEHKIELYFVPPARKRLSRPIQNHFLGQPLIDDITHPLGSCFWGKGETALFDILYFSHHIQGERINPQGREGNIDSFVLTFFHQK